MSDQIAVAFPAAADHRQEAPPPRHVGRQSRLRPPVGADDTDLLLGITTEPQFGRGEQPIDDHMVALDTIVHQLGAARSTTIQMADFAWPAMHELDEHLTPVVKGPQGLPGRIVALDAVTEVERVDVDTDSDRRRRVGSGVLLAQGDKLVFGMCACGRAASAI